MSGRNLNAAPLSLLLERSNLSGVPAYDSLLARADSIATEEHSAPGKEPLLVVAEDTVARLAADLPVRAGGSAAALLVPMSKPI